MEGQIRSKTTAPSQIHEAPLSLETLDSKKNLMQTNVHRPLFCLQVTTIAQHKAGEFIQYSWGLCG